MRTSSLHGNVNFVITTVAAHVRTNPTRNILTLKRLIVFGGMKNNAGIIIPKNPSSNVRMKEHSPPSGKGFIAANGKNAWEVSHAKVRILFVVSGSFMS